MPQNASPPAIPTPVLHPWPGQELMARPIKELKALLAERRIGHADCFEKADLARKIADTCANVTYYKQ